MDKSLQDVKDFLQNRLPTMVEQLHFFCEINSSSYNLAGLAAMSEVLKKSFMPIADNIKIIKSPSIETIDMSAKTIQQNCGDMLFIQKRPELKQRILLCGHMDTVYDVNHPFQKLKFIDKNTINGPGVADMKGGLIVILHALTAFESNNYAQNIGWDVLINADEEIGSPASKQFINDIANSYQSALVYEPAMNSHGTLAKNRKGSGKFTLIATGKAAHAGRAFNEGRNAIVYLAKAISAIHELNGKRDGVTINIGLIQGGDALNAVPEKAVAKIDVRISKKDDEKWVINEINYLIDKLKHKDYRLEIHGEFSRPVKIVNPGTDKLFSTIKDLGDKLKIAIDWQDSGGCCDGNNLSTHGLPVIDTLGVRGGDIHTHNEYILIDSLVERATLSTLLLIELAKKGMKDVIS